MPLGQYPRVTLAQARHARDDARQLLDHLDKLRKGAGVIPLSQQMA